MSTERIEKQIDLKAPPARVWRALTDHVEFGQWFRLQLEEPFAVGRVARGKILHPGYEHCRWEATIQKLEPESLFSFTWHPYAIDPQRDYAKEPSTLVEFRLQPIAGGTRLTVTESGFDRIPADRRSEALRMDEQGWAQQVKNIAAHVGSA